MSQNPEMLRRVRDACSQYRAGSIGIEHIQAVVGQAEDAVTAFEERELRKFLHWAEGEFELIRFTINEARVRVESLKIVISIEEAIERWEPGGNGVAGGNGVGSH